MSDAAKQALALLREQIDSIDSELVALLARRAEVTAQVGKIKQQYALPVYVPEREQALLSARREQAQRLHREVPLGQQAAHHLADEAGGADDADVRRIGRGKGHVGVSRKDGGAGDSRFDPPAHRVGLGSVGL